MKHIIKLVKEMSYKLQIFSFLIKGPALIYFNNEEVQKNILIPESVLNKKSTETCSIVKVAKEDTLANSSGLFRKVTRIVNRKNLLSRLI